MALGGLVVATSPRIDAALPQLALLVFGPVGTRLRRRSIDQCKKLSGVSHSLIVGEQCPY